MAQEAKFSLSEKACDGLNLFFDETMETITDESLKVFEGLYEINAAAKYRPIIIYTRELAEHYTEQLFSELIGLINLWIEPEDGSGIFYFVKDLEAGDDIYDESIAASHEIENHIIDTIKDIFMRAPIIYKGSDRVELSEYGGQEKLFSDIEELLNRFDSAVEALTDNIHKKAEAEGEENQIYLNMGMFLENILVSYRAFFRTFRKGMTENLADHISERNVSAREKVETDRTRLERIAERSEQILGDVSELFQL